MSATGFTTYRPPIIEPDGDGELLEVAMGPHHPSTHGVFRMDVALDGERVIRLKPVTRRLPSIRVIWLRCRIRIGWITSVR
jgi:hypothetical protein